MHVAPGYAVAALGGFLPGREGEDALRTRRVRAGFRSGDGLLVLMGGKLLLAAAIQLLKVIAASE